MFLDAGKGLFSIFGCRAPGCLLWLSLDVVVPLVIWNGRYGERIERPRRLPN
jgi:hypothetical protein